MEEKIRHLLASLVHPETGQDIVSSGFIEHIASAAGKITVVLRFAKARDPFAVKIKNQAEELLKREFPDQTVLVVIKPARPPAAPAGRRRGGQAGHRCHLVLCQSDMACSRIPRRRTDLQP